MTPEHLRAYLTGLKKKRRYGRASEHTYRTVLENYLTAFDVEVLNDPNVSPRDDTKQRIGRPDFDVERNGVPIGHIECKNIGADLDTEEESEQLLRYRGAFHNLLLTDYVEFRWYLRGERRGGGRLGRFDRQGLFVKDPNGADQVVGVIGAFLDTTEQSVDNPADLARRMAGKARFLRGTILDALADGTDAQLRHYLSVYRTTLIEDLTTEKFADLQAQTMTYGMFAARCLHEDSGDLFDLVKASSVKTTPLLEDVLSMVVRPRAHPDIKWAAEDIAALLARVDIKAIMSGFGQGTGKDDPIIHFYEDFLDHYDPQMRRQLGVYYTPKPVVSYIVNSVDSLLRTEFGLEGLVDKSTVPGDDPQHRVLVLEPAVGTGTFLREVISVVRRHIKDDKNEGGWDAYWGKHLLPRLFGFEFLMGPYAICHLALALELAGKGGGFGALTNHRINVYLTNTLKPQPKEGLFAPVIADESRHADEVKRKRPVMVVLGNPPYKGERSLDNDHKNREKEYKWITDLLKGKIAESPCNYFAVDGVSLSVTDKNTKWLNNDYIRFIRFAHWRIEQTGEGILGFVTDNSYLDSITARGMRQSLMKTFDSIWILDLHGNSKRKETTPDGTLDSNVFDITEGVAISLFVKHADSDPDTPARVRHAELWGPRETADRNGKYDWLARNHVNSHPKSYKWTDLSPDKPNYLFVPHISHDSELGREYHNGWKTSEIFTEKSVGITTGKDPIAVQITDKEMRHTVKDFVRLSARELMSHYHYYKKITKQKIVEAKRDVIDNQTRGRVIPFLFRPFDIRYTFYTGKSNGMITRPRKITRHMLTGNNVALATVKGQEIAGEWCHAGVSQFPMDHHAASNKEVNYVFPLYLNPPPTNQTSLVEYHGTPNLNPGFVQNITDTTGLRYLPDEQTDLVETFGPYDVFRYIYAVLHSPIYRLRYADFLKRDFPHIPVPPHADVFGELAGIGERLVALHLLEDTKTTEQRPRFEAKGTYRVEQPDHEPSPDGTGGRVRINTTQNFEGITKETWETTIGGYQPAKKWIQDRKGHTLEWDDLVHYEKLCLALAETRHIMREIDTTIEVFGGWPLN